MTDNRTTEKNASDVLRELIAERDEWKAKCETREFAYKQADAERKRYSKQIDELIAERDEWKARIAELEGQWDARDSDCILLEAKVNMLKNEITDWSELHVQVMNEWNRALTERDELARKLEIADRHEFESDQACDECKEHTDELLAKLITERDEWEAKYKSLLRALDGKTYVLDFWKDGDICHVITTDGEEIYDYQKWLEDRTIVFEK